MTEIDLSSIDAGFSDLSAGSQTVFRAALRALSHPGQPVGVAHDARVPAPGHSSSAALLLALMDAGSRLWLSPSLASGDTGPWLRFHTGCLQVADPAEAHFAWAADASELPSLDRFAQGSARYPDQSATCLIDVASLFLPSLRLPALVDAGQTGCDLILRGPGIPGQVRLRVGGLSEELAARFASATAANHAGFPCGVDIFLATPRQLVGLPRTTRVELEA
jgi:alpha-D-ribose 1-methylphosphonate 5-triphosphate synthase subunit PhnH